MTVQVTTVTGTVLAAADFVILCARVMMLPPLTSKNNVTYYLCHSPYVTDLDAAIEAYL